MVRRYGPAHPVGGPEERKSVTIPAVRPAPLIEPVYYSLRHASGRIYVRWRAPRSVHSENPVRAINRGPESWRIWLTTADHDWWERVVAGDEGDLVDQPYTPGSWAREYRYSEAGLD